MLATMRATNQEGKKHMSDKNLQQVADQGFAQGATEAAEIENLRAYNVRLGKTRVRRAYSAAHPRTVEEIEAFLAKVRP